MSTIAKSLSLLTETSLSSFFGNDMSVSEAALSPLVQNSVGHLTKIYCVARSNSSFRVVLDFTKCLASQLCGGTSGFSMQKFSLQLQDLKLDENIRALGENLPWENLPRNNNKRHCHDQFPHPNLFDVGRKLVENFLLKNAPGSLLECEILKFLKTTLGIPGSGRNKTINSPKNETEDCNLTRLFWLVAEKQWKEITENICLHSPEKVIQRAIEQVQDKIREILINNSLVSQMVEAGSFLSATTLSLKQEAKSLSHVLSGSTEHAVTGVTRFWKQHYQKLFTVESLCNTLCPRDLGVFFFEGIELFSQYIWTTKPDFDLPELMNMDFIQVHEDDFHFLQEERQLRRSILFVGVR